MARTGTDITRMADELMTAYNQSDWEKIRTLVAPDVVYIETGSGRRVEGVDAYIETLETWKRAFPDTAGTVLGLLTGDEIFAEEVRWEGTHTGPLETPNGTIQATN